MARPEKWNDDFVHIAEHACRIGATDQEVADMLKVSVRTISYWRASKPEFAAALRIGKETADNRVERSLYQRALGYSHASEKIFQNNGRVVRAKCVEHYPPETTAAIFWLKNRKPEEWRDVTRHENTGKDGGPIEMKDVSPREVLASRIAGVSARMGKAETP